MNGVESPPRLLVRPDPHRKYCSVHARFCKNPVFSLAIELPFGRVPRKAFDARREVTRECFPVCDIEMPRLSHIFGLAVGGNTCT